MPPVAGGPFETVPEDCARPPRRPDDAGAARRRRDGADDDDDAADAGRARRRPTPRAQPRNLLLPVRDPKTARGARPAQPSPRSVSAPARGHGEGAPSTASPTAGRCRAAAGAGGRAPSAARAAGRGDAATRIGRRARRDDAFDPVVGPVDAKSTAVLDTVQGADRQRRNTGPCTKTRGAADEADDDDDAAGSGDEAAARADGGDAAAARALAPPPPRPDERLHRAVLGAPARGRVAPRRGSSTRRTRRARGRGAPPGARAPARSLRA